MSLKFDIFQINDLARVVPADMEIETFIGILWWAAAVVGERAAAEPLEPMSLPREPEAVAAGDDSFLLVEPDEPAGPVTIVVATADDAAADAATAAAIAAAVSPPASSTRRAACIRDSATRLRNGRPSSRRLVATDTFDTVDTRQH